MLGLAMPVLGLRGWIIGGLALTLAGMAGALAWKDAQVSARDQQIGALNGSLDMAVATANANAAALAEAQRLARQHEAATIALLDKRETRRQRVLTQIKEVYRDRLIEVPADSQQQQQGGCPALSPVLDDALGRLRRLRAAEADPGRPGPARPDTRDVADLRR